ncbi:hypothetical protein HK100_002100, partial [Physocladia obscura]
MQARILAAVDPAAAVPRPRLQPHAPRPDCAAAARGQWSGVGAAILRAQQQHDMHHMHTAKTIGGGFPVITAGGQQTFELTNEEEKLASEMAYRFVNNREQQPGEGTYNACAAIVRLQTSSNAHLQLATNLKAQADLMLSWLEQVRYQNSSGHTNHKHGSHSYNSNFSNNNSKSSSINNPSESNSPLSNDHNHDDSDDSSNATSIALSHSRSRSKTSHARSHLRSNLAEPPSVSNITTPTTATVVTSPETITSVPAIVSDVIMPPTAEKSEPTTATPSVHSRLPTTSTLAPATATTTRASMSPTRPKSSKNLNNSSASISRLFKSKRMSSNGPDANNYVHRRSTSGTSNHSIATAGGESTKIVPSLTYTDFLEHQFKEQLRKDKERMDRADDNSTLVGVKTKPKNNGWLKVVDGDITFYVNNTTNEMQFNAPTDFEDNIAAISNSTREQQQQQEQEQEQMQSPTFEFVEELLLGTNGSTAAGPLLSPSASMLFKQSSQSLAQRNALNSKMNAAAAITTQDCYSDVLSSLPQVDSGGGDDLVAQQQLEQLRQQTQILTPSISSSTEVMLLSPESLDITTTGSVTKAQLSSGERMGAVMAHLHEMKVWFDESAETETLAESGNASVRNFGEDDGHGVDREEERGRGGSGVDGDSNNNEDEDFSNIDNVADISYDHSYQIVDACIGSSGTDGGDTIGSSLAEESVALAAEPANEQRILGEGNPPQKVTPQQSISEQQQIKPQQLHQNTSGNSGQSQQQQQQRRQSSASSASPRPSIAKSFLKHTPNGQTINTDAFFNGVNN